jgi:circadian clock protein KaiB
MVIEERQHRSSPAVPYRLARIEAISQEILLHQTELAALVRHRSEVEHEWLASIQPADERCDVNRNGTAEEDQAYPRERLRLRLYVAGRAPNSLQALSNLRNIEREHLGEGCSVEVVDALQHPLRALDDQVLVTPTLIRLSPLPVSQIVGDLSDTQAVLLALGVGAASR